MYRDDDGKYVVLSGNHRLMAAEAAGVEEFLVLCLREKPDRQTQIAHQLSHNAIVGRDDEQILRELWREIEDLELKMYSGLSSEEVERLDKASYSLISEQRVGFEEISLLFLPEEAERIKEILGGLGRRKAFVGRLSEFGEVLEGVLAVKKNQDVVNTAVAFVVLAEAVRDYLEGRAGLSEGIEEGTGDTVLLHIGATKHRVSKPTASLLRQALVRATQKGPLRGRGSHGALLVMKRDKQGRQADRFPDRAGPGRGGAAVSPGLAPVEDRQAHRPDPLRQPRVSDEAKYQPGPGGHPEGLAGVAGPGFRRGQGRGAGQAGPAGADVLGGLGAEHRGEPETVLKETQKGQERSVMTEERTGDPRYLDGVMRCIERRCHLLGLDAPAKLDLGQGGIHVYLPDNGRGDGAS